MIPARPGAKLLDVAVYAVAVAVVTTLVSGLGVVAAGGGWVGLKTALFLVGFLLFGYGTLALWRAPPGESERDRPPRPIPRDRTPFESVLSRVAPPLDELVPVADRFPPAVKLVFASLVVLGLSLSLELLFGVD